MKTGFLIFLIIGSCFVNGCSTKTNISPSSVRYSELPTGPVGLIPSAELQAKLDREYAKVLDAFASPHVLLWTHDYRTFVLLHDIPGTGVKLSGGLKDSMLRGHKVAIVLNPSIGPVFDQREMPKNFRQDVEQALKDSGFVHVYFCTPGDFLNVP